MNNQYEFLSEIFQQWRKITQKQIKQRQSLMSMMYSKEQNLLKNVFQGWMKCWNGQKNYKYKRDLFYKKLLIFNYKFLLRKFFNGFIQNSKRLVTLHYKKEMANNFRSQQIKKLKSKILKAFIANVTTTDQSNIDILLNQIRNDKPVVRILNKFNKKVFVYISNFGTQKLESFNQKTNLIKKMGIQIMQNSGFNKKDKIEYSLRFTKKLLINNTLFHNNQLKIKQMNKKYKNKSLQKKNKQMKFKNLIFQIKQIKLLPLMSQINFYNQK